MKKIYGSVTGYHPKEHTEDHLARFRTGLSAGNPADMVLLVREIDRLRERVRELEEAQQ